MNALELLRELEKTGTGRDKMDAARDVAKSLGMRLADMEAEDLVGQMAGRRDHFLVRREVLVETGGGQKLGPKASTPLPAMWPEGTIEKAQRILAGLPAVAEAAGPASAVYDIDDLPAKPLLAGQPPEVEPVVEPAKAKAPASGKTQKPGKQPAKAQKPGKQVPEGELPEPPPLPDGTP